MKTTIEIAEPLLQEARKVASREGLTLKALVEEGLRKLLAEKRKRPEFRLRKASVKGRGLHPDLRAGSWDRIRDLIYEGRGA